VKSWIVIPATGVVSAAAAITISRDPFAVAASGLAGAAVAAAVRALMADPARKLEGPAMLVAAVLAPLLVLASLAEHHAIAVAPCVSIAAIAWTIALLASQESPLVALLPATIAGVLEPAAIALVLIAGTRLVRARGRLADRYQTLTIAAPIAGGIAIMLAVIAGGAHDGAFAKLGRYWFGPAHPIAARALPALVGDALGPLTAVAALAGLAQLKRLRLAEIAILATGAGALLVDLRAGAVGPTTLAIAALLAALAIGGFARTIRMPSIQGVAGVTVAAMLLVPPTWTAVELMR
jgi:hypothetical protein